MDHRCPICRIDLGKRKRVGAVVAQMEIDCPNCKSGLRLNVHPAEVKAVFVSFAAFVVPAALGYWLRRQDLLLLALAGGLIGASAIPLLERTYLRHWPRYVLSTPNRERNGRERGR